MEIPQGYIASPISSRLFLKHNIDKGKVILLFNGVPKPHFVSDIVSRVSHNLRLSSVKFRIHLYTHSWLRAIQEVKKEICSTQIYQNLKSIEIQVGRNCRETRYFNDTLVNSLEGLGILLVESTSRKSGTTSGMKLKFYSTNPENKSDESSLMNLVLNNLGENEIEYYNLGRRVLKKLSPNEEKSISDNDWIRSTSNQLCQQLVPIERLDHFCHNLEIDFLSQPYLGMDKEEIIYNGIQAFFHGRDFQEAKSEFDNILTSLGVALDKTFSKLNSETQSQPLTFGPSGIKKLKLSNEYSLENGRMEALIILPSYSPFLEKEASDFQKSIESFGFHTALNHQNTGFGQLIYSIPRTSTPSCLLVSLFSTGINSDAEKEIIATFNSSQFIGVPKVFLFNYCSDANIHLSQVGIIQRLQRRDSAVKEWNDFIKTLDLMDSIICLSYSSFGSPNSSTFARTLIAVMTESNYNDEDFTSTLFQVASRSSGSSFELKYFQFGLSKKLCFKRKSDAKTVQDTFPYKL